MSTPPMVLRSTKSSRLQRWIIKALYGFDRSEINDWLALMSGQLERPGGASPMLTAGYVCQLLGYADDLRSAAQLLAVKGNPSGRSNLADAALEINDAVESLCRARDGLLAAAGADRIIPNSGP